MVEELRILGNIELDRIRFTLENLGWKVISVDLDEDIGRIKFCASKTLPKEDLPPEEERLRL